MSRLAREHPDRPELWSPGADALALNRAELNDTPRECDCGMDVCVVPGECHFHSGDLCSRCGGDDEI